jgi:hypothetical protein
MGPFDRRPRREHRTADTSATPCDGLTPPTLEVPLGVGSQRVLDPAIGDGGPHIEDHLGDASRGCGRGPGTHDVGGVYGRDAAGTDRGPARS